MARISFGQSNHTLHNITHHCPVTLFLMAVSIIVAALTEVGKRSEKMDVLFFSSQRAVEEAYYTSEQYDAWRESDPSEIMRRNAVIDAHRNSPMKDLQRGEAWRAVTPIFLHFGFLHIIFNMMWLWQFGVVLEMRFRPLRFLTLVLWIAVASNAAQALFSGSNFGGMSGVNYGLFGFLLARMKLHPEPGFVLHRQTVALLLIWLVVCFTGAMGSVANTAHLVGFLSGGLVGVINAFQSGGWALMKRKQQFRQSLRRSSAFLHECAVCARTEHDDRELEFFVHPSDGKEYCKDHLPEDSVSSR
jgi:membrane associated rhomboid family serine protease